MTLLVVMIVLLFLVVNVIVFVSDQHFRIVKLSTTISYL